MTPRQSAERHVGLLTQDDPMPVWAAMDLVIEDTGCRLYTASAALRYALAAWMEEQREDGYRGSVIKSLIEKGQYQEASDQLFPFEYGCWNYRFNVAAVKVLGVCREMDAVANEVPT